MINAENRHAERSSRVRNGNSAIKVHATVEEQMGKNDGVAAHGRNDIGSRRKILAVNGPGEQEDNQARKIAL